MAVHDFGEFKPLIAQIEGAEQSNGNRDTQRNETSAESEQHCIILWSHSNRWRSIQVCPIISHRIEFPAFHQREVDAYATITGYGSSAIGIVRCRKTGRKIISLLFSNLNNHKTNCLNYRFCGFCLRADTFALHLDLLCSGFLVCVCALQRSKHQKTQSHKRFTGAFTTKLVI